MKPLSFHCFLQRIARAVRRKNAAAVLGTTRNCYHICLTFACVHTQVCSYIICMNVLAWCNSLTGSRLKFPSLEDSKANNHLLDSHTQVYLYLASHYEVIKWRAD